MASFATLLRSQFLGQDHHHIKTSTTHHRKQTSQPQPRAEFNILKMMGGRGLCNGEKGLEQELKKQVDHKEETTSNDDKGEENSDIGGSSVVAIPEDGFEKEMMGLTGGFPGGEKGLIKFIEENPPRNSSQPFTIEENNQSFLEESKTS
ncbi:NAD(P)H-quinone oxidoreductase subunit S, chloroplastic-like [Cicer arietinum]|uniref:NAD(P)H-quinone oxidoreductase subunit S, chloroplastic-like n=1 Tax=Cicer arietinum TaxID=3827 RepID=A0A1S2XPY2_CICAR|nr:NAD(P)H-quinone oxidoreductase subunit S, chloroplastic-like [Cicer arietinum]